jgi:hypothetical protein
MKGSKIVFLLSTPVSNKQTTVSLPLLSTLILIIASIFIYKRYKTEDEELLILKLFGYYLLGSFKFKFNGLALPVEGYVFWVHGNKRADEGDHTTYSSDNNKAYILSNTR